MKKILLVIIASLSGGYLIGQTVSLPNATTGLYEFVTGTAISSSNVNSNFSLLNDRLTIASKKKFFFNCRYIFGTGGGSISAGSHYCSLFGNAKDTFNTGNISIIDLNPFSNDVKIIGYHVHLIPKGSITTGSGTVMVDLVSGNPSNSAINEPISIPDADFIQATNGKTFSRTFTSPFLLDADATFGFKISFTGGYSVSSTGFEVGVSVDYLDL